MHRAGCSLPGLSSKAELRLLPQAPKAEQKAPSSVKAEVLFLSCTVPSQGAQGLSWPCMGMGAQLGPPGRLQQDEDGGEILFALLKQK